MRISRDDAFKTGDVVLNSRHSNAYFGCGEACVHANLESVDSVREEGQVGISEATNNLLRR